MQNKRRGGNGSMGCRKHCEAKFGSLGRLMVYLGFAMPFHGHGGKNEQKRGTWREAQ